MALEMRNFVRGDIHLMVNPSYAYWKEKMIEAGNRLHTLFNIMDPAFDTSHLVIKVPATWEGLQACHELQFNGIKTLATTVFTMEQAVLAGEAGCVSISPFVHELKAVLDQSYQDSDSLLDLCLKAQRWYKQESLPTKVKACATIGLDEILQLAGVTALTLVPDDIKMLQAIQRPQFEVSGMSLFTESGVTPEIMQYPSYLHDELKYRIDFNLADHGRAQLKLGQIFCDFQAKAECVVRTERSGSV
ncbi:hypothetical protein N7462_005317 [Penicillium macrosclerotiorum]|uniref:uncharacterized protein n=1 Tax=Penicillium macrosclerotiorum TaxID=303699 RepID=UPI002548ED5F|nr:uncharacterized protein N7462_005317 [Penicillium macrosclerotiorum]KAJ5682152.1 hypothetical protein N7462_005317 [Penicillium macrosclerotiorum]